MKTDNSIYIYILKFRKIEIVPFILVFIATVGLFGCKKLVSISPPQSSITSEEVFSNDQEATSAMAGLYYNFVNSYSPPNFGSGGITLFAGCSADEFIVFNSSNSNFYQFYQDNILPTNSTLNGNLWTAAYASLYQANAVLAGLDASTGIDDSVKNELKGEALFMRALINFYLTNLFGKIPLVTSVNWQTTNTLSQSTTDQVYNLIIADLNQAAQMLPANYSVGNNEKIVPNKYAAISLLSRAYLYQGKWSQADSASSIVIGSAQYSLEPNLVNVFLANSSEAILQLKQDNDQYTNNATAEGYYFIPYSVSSYTAAPNIYLSNYLLKSFDNNDDRLRNWIDSISYDGKIYYFPYKYKVGSAQEVPNGPETEYYMVLRLAEQYLIKAEADANGAGSGVAGAIDALNIIRRRAGLSSYNGPITEDSVMEEVHHQRQLEMFAEWGNRWFDLKRWGTAASTLSASKGFAVSSNSLLYPIPTYDLSVDPNLVQNGGY